ncbi:MAG: hypothetical protein LJE94_02170 [Deltaproteobacteria bacterium]|nr:hypothetical protein [Deltaproteobacteria bacterium]
MHQKAIKPAPAGHRKKCEPRLSELVDMNNPASVLEEIKTIVRSIDAGYGEIEKLERAFQDILRLFNGHYPGYRKCNTPYHDLNHTTDTVLAMARLIHGARLSGFLLKSRDITLGLIAALMHDVGYIQRDSESEGTGARFSQVHIPRGIAFMRTYMRRKGYSTYDYRKCRAALLCTDLSLPVHTILFETRTNELMGKMLATADLVGQTADRRYLEKLKFLYQEFREAGMRDYGSELELLRDSLVFNSHIKSRLADDLGGVDRILTGHFKARWGIDRNLYRDGMNKNVTYLKYFLNEDPEHYSRFLKRMEGS